MQPKKNEPWNLETRVKNGLSSASTSKKPHRPLQNLRNACMKPFPLTNTGLFQPFPLERRYLRPSRVKRFAQDHTSMGRKMRTKSLSFHLLRYLSLSLCGLGRLLQILRNIENVCELGGLCGPMVRSLASNPGSPGTLLNEPGAKLLSSKPQVSICKMTLIMVERT